MKLCVFQGTFNPIHLAHLKVAEYIYQNYDFDKILFIPAYHPPHKNYDKEMCIHRYNMVKLAIQNLNNYDISDIEYQNESFSYTYLTILELYKQYKIDNKINFIIGTDAFEKIESWYETNKLKELVEFIVFKRTDNFNPQDFEHLKEKGYHFKFAEHNFNDISSTQLRLKIRNNERINNIVTKEVEDYINRNELYKN